MTFKIEADIPPPVDGSKYPFKSMQPGESFLIPKGGPRTNIHMIAKRQGVKIVTRTMNTGLRVWRVE